MTTPYTPAHMSVPAPRTVSRRAVVRAGGQAAWAVPAITVATAAPAFASSDTLAISGLTALYDPAAMSTLVVRATVQSADSLALGIPGGLFDSVEAPGATVVAHGGGWTLTFPEPDPDFSTLISLGSTTEAPWRGHWGPDISLAAMVSGGSGSLSKAAEVPEGSAGTVMLSRAAEAEVGTPGKEQTFTAEWIEVDEDYLGVTGPITVAVSIARRDDEEPVLDSFGPETWQLAWPATAHTPEAWVFRFRTVQEWHTSRTGVPTDRGPARSERGATFVARFSKMSDVRTTLQFSTTNALGTVTDMIERNPA